MSALLTPGVERKLTIDRLGGLGDGVATLDGVSVYIPYTLPQETLRAEIAAVQGGGVVRAVLREVLNPSPERQLPACPHFTQCGGCNLQHLSPKAYSGFKLQAMQAIAARLGITPEALQPLYTVGAGSRRRVELKVSVTKGEVKLGFLAAHSHQLVEITACPVAEPAISALLTPLRDCLAALKQASRIVSVQLTALSAGVDMLLLAREHVKPADAERLRGFAAGFGLIRLVVQQEQEVQTQRVLYGSAPLMALGGVELELPVGTFLQASSIAQTKMTELVQEALKDCRRVADLYAGCGAYSLPLVAQGLQVHAFEGAEPMAVALENTCRRFGLERTLQVERRDLVARPLSADELNIYDGAVINPPRNGALPQVRQLAASGLRRVVMVSCNPATFERDMSVLLQGGFTVASLTAIDQFYWSHHLELVAILQRNL